MQSFLILCLGLVAGTIMAYPESPTSPKSDTEPLSCSALCSVLAFFLHCLAKCPVNLHLKHFLSNAEQLALLSSADDLCPGLVLPQ